MRFVPHRILRASPVEDFEDAVLHEAACHAGAQYIVTRNVADFKKARLPVFAPNEFIGAMESLKKSSAKGAKR